ncbi:ABC transporter ATP-binding protein [Stackebrandtia nassauensis]|uniref:ABC transporter related protein n=1 Tax=Stackebrandtia nassauensis (strain DSM 44728 / CIP 108903 / NRRL B-16338 / NBRC 102104 / LLR-40K-21) TaxID=446470 RepID=D3Q424_STANL|nr:ABC transporter ATP-binding protein [Stackebrandtia nassauensis]ADD45909.1 ABC transporter related protein [Stackebrandtia nassauensis DSM 44728]
MSTDTPKAALLPLLRGRLRPYRSQLAAILGLQGVQALSMLYLPTLNADIVDNGIVAGDTGYILRHGGVMLAVTIVQVVATAAAVYLGSKVAMGLGRDLRAAIFARVQDFSAREVNRFDAPSLITRTTNDVQQIQVLVLFTATMLLSSPFMAIGGLVLALGQDVPLTGVLAVLIPVLAVAMGLIISRLIPPSRLMQTRIDSVNQVMREQITGIRVIRAFVRDGHEQRRFGEANDDLMTVAIRVGRIQAYFGATAMLISSLASIAVVWFGGPRIASGEMQLGSLIAFLNYLGMILMAVMMTMSVFMLVPRGKVTAGRIMEVLDTEPSVAEPASPAPAPTRGQLELRGAGFGYPGAEQQVLCDITLTAPPGRTTAIVGSTGSGKTTLINLAARLMDVDTGGIAIDGVDLRSLDRRTLAATIGLIPQRAYLFSGTIASNLRYGDPDASDEQLWEALRIAQAADFVAGLPDGLGTGIGQGGVTVSGGQRQRLAIARALVAKPMIYLFDDAFSALDTATDAALRAALAEKLAGTTQIIVAQRISTIREADQIVVLDSGRVEAVGTHEQLMETSPTYTEIVNSQLTPQEAA